MKTIDASATTPASRDAVWAQLADVTRWSQWGPWKTVEVEGGGEHGPGAVRRLVMGPMTLREQVTDWEPGERMGYRVLDGMKLEDYEATVTLHDAPGGGTELRWHAEYAKAGLLAGLLLKRAIPDVCHRVAKAATQG